MPLSRRPFISRVVARTDHRLRLLRPRLLAGAARARGGGDVGLYGISLGGYVSALVAGLEDDLSCVIAGIPCVDFPNLARDNEPWIMRRYGGELRVDWSVVRTVSPQDSATVAAIQLTKPFKALMDVHIVNEEINEAVYGNANSHECEPKPTCYI